MDLMVLTPETLAIITGTIVPALVAFVTKCRASALVKLIATTILSAGATALTSILAADGSAILSQATFQTFALAFATAVISYKSIWKALKINERLSPSKGFGEAIQPPESGVYSVYE